MANVPALIPENLRKKEAPASRAMAKTGPAEPIRFYVVLEDRLVPRGAGAGGGSFMLRKGKEISSGSYSIKALLSAGANIREIPTPAWFLERQVEARETHQAWADAGLDVGEVPAPYEAPEVKRAKPAQAAGGAAAT